jgi:hypothetical protein
MVAIVGEFADPAAPSFDRLVDVRYFTLEHGHDIFTGRPCTMLGEWTRHGTHHNFGSGPADDTEAFVEAVLDLLQTGRPPHASSHFPPADRPERSQDVPGRHWYALIWALAFLPLGFLAIVVLSSALRRRWRDSFPRKARTVSRHGGLALLLNVLLSWLLIWWQILSPTAGARPTWLPSLPSWTINAMRPCLDGDRVAAEIQQELFDDTGEVIPVSCPEKIPWSSIDMCTATPAGESFTIALDVQEHGSYSFTPIQMISGKRLDEEIRRSLQEPAGRGRLRIDKIDCPPFVIARAGRRAKCRVSSGNRVKVIELRFTDTRLFTVHPM